MISRFLKLVILIAIGCVLGCANLSATATSDERRLLSTAIASTDSKSSSCRGSDWSTENGEILDILRSHRYQIISHGVSSDEDGTFHEFFLKTIEPEIRIRATIHVVGNKCSIYSFNQVVEDK